MTDFDQLREDIIVCSRAALTPAPTTSAAASHSRAADGTPGAPAAPRTPRGRAFHVDWYESRDEVADLFVWLTDYSVGVPIDKIGEFIRNPIRWTPEYRAMIAWEQEEAA